MYNDRDGMQLLADFYTLSTYYDRKNIVDVELAQKLLPRVRSRILRDVAVCIVSELKYAFTQWEDNHVKTFRRFGICQTKVMEVYNNGNTFRLLYPFRKYYELKRLYRPELIVSAARAIFRRPYTFSEMYGGPAWADICTRWLDVHNHYEFFDNEPNNNHGEQYVRLDRLIDAAHNNGRCLDKVYDGINHFLTKKTRTTDPYWIIDQSSIKKYSYRRMKERFGMTRDQFRVQTKRWTTKCSVSSYHD